MPLLGEIVNKKQKIYLVLYRPYHFIAVGGLNKLVMFAPNTEFAYVWCGHNHGAVVSVERMTKL